MDKPLVARDGSSDPRFEDADFSRPAIRRRVRRDILQHPAVIYPAAAGLVGLAALALLGPGVWTLSATIGGLGVALLSVGLGLGVFRDALSARHVRALAARVEVLRRQRIQRTEERLSAAGAAAARDQFRRLSGKLAAFESVLEDRLEPGELTYLRYRGIAEQVFLASLDNLDRAADALAGIAAIDEDFIRARRAALQAEPGGADLSAEVQALDTRLALLETHRGDLRRLLTQNEQAMTTLDVTSSAVAKLATGKRHATTDLDSAMQELQRLAERARQYDHS